MNVLYLYMGDYHGLLRLDLFLNYAVVRFGREREELSFKIYISDALRLLPQNSYPKSRWYELIKPQPSVDAHQIVDDITSRAGITIT